MRAGAAGRQEALQPPPGGSSECSTQLRFQRSRAQETLTHTHEQALNVQPLCTTCICNLNSNNDHLCSGQQLLPPRRGWRKSRQYYCHGRPSCPLLTTARGALPEPRLALPRARSVRPSQGLARADVPGAPLAAPHLPLGGEETRPRAWPASEPSGRVPPALVTVPAGDDVLIFSYHVILQALLESLWFHTISHGGWGE